MNQLPLAVCATATDNPMTEHEAELCMLFDRGITHGQHSAVWVVKGVDNAPSTFFTHYELRNDGICTRKYNNIRLLLAAVQAIAPIEQWTKATENGSNL